MFVSNFTINYLERNTYTEYEYTTISAFKVYKASLVAMMAGSDFIKTSTGKESINATLPFGIVMSRAINDYHQKVGYRVSTFLFLSKCMMFFVLTI